MDFVIVLFILFVGGGWLIGKAIGSIFFPYNGDSSHHDRPENIFIDRSVHHHFHVHDNSKSAEIKSLGKYVDDLHDSLDVDYEDVTNSTL